MCIRDRDKAALAFQICGPRRDADNVVGIVADTSSGLEALAAVQKTIKGWSEAKCLVLDDSQDLDTTSLLVAGPVLDQPDEPVSEPNVSAQDNAMTLTERGLLVPRTYCTNAKKVVEGNTCANIADKRCTISLTKFMSYNPNLDCDNLRVGQNFCCNEGTVPRDDECSNAKQVVEGNTCSNIADKRCTISLTKFMSYNPGLDCDNLKVGQWFCCNAGSVPLPTCTNIKTVNEGDTCTTIADKRCTVSLSKWMDYNPVRYSP